MEEETCLSKNSAALGYQIRKVDIAKDGNCLFHAVEDQLRILEQTDHTYKSLRALAVQELRVNLDNNHVSMLLLLNNVNLHRSANLLYYWTWSPTPLPCT